MEIVFNFVHLLSHEQKVMPESQIVKAGLSIGIKVEFCSCYV